MEELNLVVGDILRNIVSVWQAPVVILLFIALIIVLVYLGTLIAEYFTEHRHFRVFLPKLIDDIEEDQANPAQVIKSSGLLLRQKKYLVELTRHPQITDASRESLAVGLEYQERRRYEHTVKGTDVLSRVAPLLGLLGTLIPLGPGIVALSSGDTETLSSSLLTAFDTTSLGLIVSGFAIVISAIRKRWYKDYMVCFDAVMECVLEVEKNGDGSAGTQNIKAAAKIYNDKAIAKAEKGAARARAARDAKAKKGAKRNQVSGADLEAGVEVNPGGTEAPPSEDAGMWMPKGADAGMTDGNATEPDSGKK